MTSVKLFSLGAVFAAALWAAAPVDAAAQASGPLEFELADVEGRLHRLSSYRGRWVVVNYFATWCGPCRREIPELNVFAREHAGRAVVIGVDFEEIGPAQLAAFIDELEIDYLVLRVGEEPAVPFEPLLGLPTTFLVDPLGRLVERHVGPTTSEALAGWLERHGG